MSDNLTQAIQRWKWFTTVELEQKLDQYDLDHGERNQIEYALMQRRKNYYNAPVHLHGSDGSSITIKSAAGQKGRRFVDWDIVVAAENAYIDQLFSKPQLTAYKQPAETSSLIRKIVPSMIATQLVGVQPMHDHIDALPWFNTRKAEVLSKSEVDHIVAADKDLQPVAGNLWTDRLQQIGRGLRPTVHFGDLHISDYMGLIHTDLPKSSTAIARLMDSIKQSEATLDSFFDTETTYASGIIGGDFFNKIDTSKWIAQYKADTDRFIEDAIASRRPYFDNIMDDSVSLTYPSTMHAIDVAASKKCAETSNSSMVNATTPASMALDDMWKLHLNATAEALVRSKRAISVVAADAPRGSGRLMAGVSDGIYPIHKPFTQDFFIGEASAYKTDATISVHAEANLLSEMTVSIPKKRKPTSETLEVKFDHYRGTQLWEAWADSHDKQLDRVSETLALLGIGEK